MTTGRRKPTFAQDQLLLSGAPGSKIDPIEGIDRRRRRGRRAECDDCARVAALASEVGPARFPGRMPGGGRPANLDMLHARHQEYGVEACEAVVVHMARRLRTDRDTFYFRPTTLFRPQKFPDYLAHARADQQRRRTDEWGRCLEHGGYNCAACGLP